MSSYPSSYNNIKEIFHLSNEDFVYVQSFSAGDNRFLLRHNNLSILSSVSFANQYFANSALLASGYKFEKQFNELHSKYGNDLNRHFTAIKGIYKTTRLSNIRIKYILIFDNFCVSY